MDAVIERAEKEEEEAKKRLLSEISSAVRRLESAAAYLETNSSASFRSGILQNTNVDTAAAEHSAALANLQQMKILAMVQAKKKTP